MKLKKPSIARSTQSNDGPRRPALRPCQPVARIMAARERYGMSRYRLAQMSQTDQSYLARLEKGFATGPGRNVLLRLGKALVEFTSKFTREDVDRILDEAGMAPSPEWLWSAGPGEFGPVSGRSWRFQRRDHR